MIKDIRSHLCSVDRIINQPDYQSTYKFQEQNSPKLEIILDNSEDWNHIRDGILNKIFRDYSEQNKKAHENYDKYRDIHIFVTKDWNKEDFAKEEPNLDFLKVKMDKFKTWQDKLINFKSQNVEARNILCVNALDMKANMEKPLNTALN